MSITFKNLFLFVLLSMSYTLASSAQVVSAILYIAAFLFAVKIFELDNLDKSLVKLTKSLTILLILANTISLPGIYAKLLAIVAGYIQNIPEAVAATYTLSTYTLLSIAAYFVIAYTAKFYSNSKYKYLSYNNLVGKTLQYATIVFVFTLGNYALIANHLNIDINAYNNKYGYIVYSLFVTVYIAITALISKKMK